MPKHQRESSPSDLTSTKRIRNVTTIPVDRLSSLSNELLLHILSFLPISSLNVCQRLSHRFHALGGDSELWKRQYYSQWVRPRARRLANSRLSALPARAEYSPRVSTWLDHSHLAEEGKVTNWKRQYRLRHNWSNGSCRMTEVEFLAPPCPAVLVKLCAGIVFTADVAHGLRAWAAKDPTSCLSSISFSESKDSTIRPTSLAVSQLPDEQEIVVGFENGRFNRYVCDVRTCRLGLQSSHVGFRDGAITAMALSSPYLLMVSQHKILSLCNLRTRSTGKAQDAVGLCEIASLQAENMVAPMTLSLRVSTFEIVATIVYSFYHIGCGWSLGIQELRFSKDGQQLESRLTTTVDSQYGIRPLQRLPSSNKRRHSANIDPVYPSVTPTEPSILHQQPPTSMSYSHPYLLTSHADNTLTMYLLVSNSNSLFVRGGRRLWGHTSSVSTVQVTNRGKAVSVNSLGNEIRIWELETTVPSLGSRRPLKEESSIQVSPDNRQLENRSKTIPQETGGLDLVSSAPHACMHECVGFDEERVLLLREKTAGTQLLECYDFT